MIHNEHLRAPDELYEIRYDNIGNAIHVYIKDDEAWIFPTLECLVQNVWFDNNEVPHKRVPESWLETIYEQKEHCYHKMDFNYAGDMNDRLLKPDDSVVVVEAIDGCVLKSGDLVKVISVDSSQDNSVELTTPDGGRVNYDASLLLKIN